MSKKPNQQDLLRTKAETQLVNAPASDGGARPVENLLHELQVHQIELKMQNEELRIAQVALEEARDRYVDLYEFAPVGYLTLSREGQIASINLTGATLFGEDRKKLLQRRFERLIVPVDHDRWQRYFMHVMQHGDKQICELALQRSDGTHFDVRLDSLLIVADAAAPVLRITLTDITARTQAEEALRVSALNKLLFENSRDALMLLVPPLWKFTGANQATLQLFGASSVAEFTALGPWDVSPTLQPDGCPSSEKAQEMIAIAMREGSHFFEWQHQRLGGQPFDTDVLLTRMEVGREPFLQATVRDITERKQLEQQLSRRLRHRDIMEHINQLSLNSASIEELLERVLDEILAVFNADRAFFLYPCDPDAPSWSVPMERTRPEWPGALARGMVIPTNPDVAEVFRELLASTEPLPYGPAASRRSPASVDEQFAVRSQIQMALRPRVGSPWVMGLHHCAQARAYDEDELLIFKDIGQRVADALSSMIMLKNLRELNNDFVTLLENTGDFIYFKDQDSRIRFCSQTLANITGHTSWREMIGKHDLEIFPKDTARIYYEEELPIFREGKPLLNKTDPYYDEQGRPGWVNTNKWPVFGEDKKTVVGIFGISRDITELKEAEDKIHELNRDLERRVAERTAQLAAANKELEAFSYSVSHDLRTPLRAIDGFSHILLEDYTDKLDDEGKRLLNVVRENTSRMGQLIDDMLKFSRTGRMELIVSEINMEKLAREVFEELQPSVADGKLQVEIEPIPAAKGDRAMMRQVFVNLLSNAIKFSRSKEPAMIKVGGSIEGNEAIYYVKDNGVGFDMQYANKLFGVFQRLHSVTEFEGTGIGLAIVKRVITRHGGRVWAEGKVGEGTTIYFALPTKEKEHG